MGKGSTSRPFEVTPEVFAERHALAFGQPKIKPRYVPPPLPKDYHGPDAIATVADKKDVQPAHPVPATRTQERLGSALEITD
jgi:hypothetical protein